MDINPYEFRDANAYELAAFHRDAGTDVVVFSSAWSAAERN